MDKSDEEARNRDNNPVFRDCSNEDCENRFESVLPQNERCYCEDCQVYYDLDSKEAELARLREENEKLKFRVNLLNVDANRIREAALLGHEERLTALRKENAALRLDYKALQESGEK